MFERVSNAIRETREGPSISNIGLGFIYRVLGILLVPSFLRLNITANVVTLIGGAVGLLGALAFAGGSYPFLVAGAILVQMCILIDFIDGGVARARGEASNYGDWLDLIVDRIVDTAVFFGLCWGYFRLNAHATIWIWGFVAISFRTLIGAFTHITALYVPESLAMVKSDLRGQGYRRILKWGAYNRINLHFLICLLCLFDRVYLLMIILSLYGALFYFGSIAFLHNRVKTMAGAPKDLG